ncbi:MSHA biogenesis protein MshC [Zobellella taiwanensis]|uniref:MSHA biogenesis protein MshC n=1 Tax=Zobellella taiwanensis TaxID=347535 RepID=A0A2P7RAI1_9GAMM|nr:prepilin-type N-terminal cleavage/methylation domain-containing protein [Zobellella taiwanensis]PSJ47248.1 MSHA biogenesis protein MshC [Zobellella taiwanensis]
MTLQRGFTLLELVLVLVIIGILAAVAIPRLPVSGNFNDSLQARNLAGLLRLAQLRAMNDPDALKNMAPLNRCGVLAVTAGGISLSANCQDAVLLNEANLEAPSNELWLGASLPVTANQSLPFTLQFGEVVDPDYLSEASRLGRPFVNSGAGYQLLPNTLQITLAGQTVLIEPEGYIHVAR